ncbi:MAG: TIGR01212 family radical SAM protein [Desulfobacterales bacterium]|nr:TIGR01212 family radical SAM protein [Desulfobacterales bacterium]MDD4072968.1 TIGR01212 family radical SAM protein [Desulfobacterales bacterium]MDD4392277.1 TIGR01212 family radical SAM protein [Desulfobacterales bacterium]
MKKRYNDLNTYLRGIFNCRVQKISVDAGLTCPNRDGTISTGGCIFCNGNGSGTGAHGKGLSVSDQLLQGKRGLQRRYKAKKFIAYFQSFTNTYAPIDTLRSIYEEALSIDDIVGLSIGTRPDCISTPVLELLEHYARQYLIWVEYGLQSAHDRTLEFINRGHTFNCFKDAVNRTRNRNIRICAHIILGLPHETRRDMLDTIKAISDLGIDGVKLHLLYVVKGTKLETLYRQNNYTCLEQHEYAELICDMLELLPPDMIIQRLTGDPHPDELIAPLWSMRKSETLTLINSILMARDSWQGKFFAK